MSGGLEWEPLKLDHLGKGGPSGGLIEEVEEAIRKIAQKVMDEDHYKDSGKVAVNVVVKRHGDSVVVGYDVKAVQPGKLGKATTAYVNKKGEVVTQKGDQLTIFDAKKVLEEARKGQKGEGN